MKDDPQKLHTGYLVEGLELFIRKVAYTKYDEPFWFAGPTILSVALRFKDPWHLLRVT
jgi:hypothetical protein